MMNRQMLVIAVIFGMVVCASVSWASAPLNVSVTLDGPDEGFADEGLPYLATGSFDLDGATQTEVANGEATVEEDYAWSCEPASCDTAPADSAEETFRFALEHAPGEYTITVYYTVTVHYRDGTLDQGWDSDSAPVEIRPQLVITVVVVPTQICAGGMESAPHQATVTVTVEYGVGGPVHGARVDFGATHASNQLAPKFTPDHADTDYLGQVTTTLTSGDGVAVGKVIATCEGVTGESEEDVNFGAPQMSFQVLDPITEEPLEVLYADGESQALVVLTLTYGLEPVAAHSICWAFRFWGDDLDPGMSFRQ